MNHGWKVPTGNDEIEACNQCVVAQFIQGTNVQYKGYLRHLWNSYLDGDNLYPATVHEAYNMSQRRKENQTHYKMANQRKIYSTFVALAVTRWGIIPTHQNA